MSKLFRFFSENWLKLVSFKYLKLIIFILCFTFIVKHLEEKKISDFYIISSAIKTHWLLLWVLLALLPINWAFEAFKWRILVRRLENISIISAYKGVLTGVVFSFVSPQAFGDYAGRLLHLKTVSRLKSAGALLVGNFAQLWITLFFGFISAWHYCVNHLKISNELSIYFILFLIVANGLILLFYFRISLLFGLVERIYFLKKLLPYIEIMAQYKAKELATVLLFSFLRYLVFSFQFVIAMKILQIDLPVLLQLQGIAIVFFVKSVIPTLNAFGDLGLREFSALLFFSAFTATTERVVAASLLLWVTNILLPACVGLIFIFRIKIFPQKSNIK